MKVEREPSSKPFSHFSTDELLAEIIRRRNARATRGPIVQCDKCAHFVPSETEYANDAYNPCAKKHEMSFRMPDPEAGPLDDDWGFFRRVCADREAV
jgi:hypothetical protein